MHVLAMVNQKGGCGKTTTAVNLAGALVAKRKRVLLVDLDPQAHATDAVGCAVRDGPSLLEVKICMGSRDDLGRPTSTPGENKRAFMAVACE